MNSQQLQCFAAVADRLSFSKAAKELYFSVPTVTHHIRQLESEIGAQLFVRSKKMVKLTEAGMIFYPYAKDMLLCEDMAVKSLLAGTKKGHLRIGCSSSAELVLLTSVMERFRCRYPDVDPFISIDTYDRLMAMLEAEQIDLMMGSIHMHKRSTMVFRKLVMMKTYAVMKKQHRLAERESLDFAELEEERLILPHQKLIPLESDNPIRDLVNTHRLHHRDYIAEDDRACLSLAGSGYGVAVLPGYRLPEYIDELGLVIIPINENVDFPYGVMLKEDGQDERVEYFIKEAGKKLRLFWKPQTPESSG